MSMHRRTIVQEPAAAGSLAARQGPPGRQRDYRVLEIFMAGGLSHRETLWVDEPGETTWWRDVHELDPQSDPFFTGGSGPGHALWASYLRPQGDYLSASYQLRGGSRPVHLGPGGVPLTMPLSDGGTLRDRLRVLAMHHELPDHADAQRVMLQGELAADDPRRAGPGAAIARHTGLPSFVFYDCSSDAARMAADLARPVGRHGSRHAPRLAPFGDPSLVGRLEGTLEGDRLTFPDAGVSQVPETPWDNGVRRALVESASLLQGGESAYCAVIDGGRASSWYDTHGLANTAAVHNRNLLNLLRTLYELVEAGQLDLDQTLVVLNTEFGRDPAGWDRSSDHTLGFCAAVLGGPVLARAGDRLVGDLETSASGEDPKATEPPGLAGGFALRPTDLRAAVFHAAGIDPLQPDVFAADDIGRPTCDPAADLYTTIFG